MFELSFLLHRIRETKILTLLKNSVAVKYSEIQFLYTVYIEICGLETNRLYVVLPSWHVILYVVDLGLKGKENIKLRYKLVAPDDMTFKTFIGHSFANRASY